MKEAMLYDKLEENEVQCALCAHRCLIKPGRLGICGVRENKDGTLYSLVYAQTVSANVDPIEKKPLYHFLPGTGAFSIATVGCNGDRLCATNDCRGGWLEIRGHQ
jgi:Pyruvate-formate lyase-activating enzyme